MPGTSTRTARRERKWSAWHTTQSRGTAGFRSVFHRADSTISINAVLTIGELQFQFHRTVHDVPCWAMRVSNGVNGDLFYTADTGPAAHLVAAATGLAHHSC
jgi:ribonuclease BN (tRNA processing enzyme)